MDAQRRHGAEPLFPRLRACTGGGAPIPPEVHAELRALFGIPGVVGSWGLTEFPIATSARPSDPPSVLAHTVGQPSGPVQVRAISPAGDPAAPGEEGELVLHGPQQFLGYLDAGLDAAAFTADGWFRTGDLGRVDADGNVRITGRLKDIIIRNAENISAQEIEDALHRQAGVLEAAVVGMPDARTGERVCAVVVLHPGRVLDLEAVRANCRALGLARAKVPEQLVIVDSLPRNSMGKVLKQDLQRRLMTS
jgi:acyl-CoA synthetase (AMP-forming)/AMP-acid ligase II